jgi:hypothetical protein
MKFKEIEFDGNNVVAAAEYEDGARIIFRWDEGSDSPREWDNIGTLCMWHSRYNLPQEGGYGDAPQREDFIGWCVDNDVRPTCSGQEAVEQLGVEWFMMWGSYYLDHCEGWTTNKWQDRLVERAMNYIHKNYVWSLVGMYDHSGLSFSHVSSYNYGGWDSGVVGCHYVSVEKLAKEFPGMTKAQRLVAANNNLKAELDTYDMWQCGNVVWFELLDKDGDLIDSCCGFITDKHEVADLIKEVAYYLPGDYGVTNEC